MPGNDAAGLSAAEAQRIAQTPTLPFSARTPFRVPAEFRSGGKLEPGTKILGPDFVPARNGPADIFHARYPGLIDGRARKFEVLYEARA